MDYNSFNYLFCCFFLSFCTHLYINFNCTKFHIPPSYPSVRIIFVTRCTKFSLSNCIIYTLNYSKFSIKERNCKNISTHFTSILTCLTQLLKIFVCYSIRVLYTYTNRRSYELLALKFICNVNILLLTFVRGSACL